MVGVRERGGPGELDAIYIGRKRNSNQLIKPIQDSGLDSAGSGRSGKMSSTTTTLQVLAFDIISTFNEDFCIFYRIMLTLKYMYIHIPESLYI